jgi:hypothetical protein
VADYHFTSLPLGHYTVKCIDFIISHYIYFLTSYLLFSNVMWYICPYKCSIFLLSLWYSSVGIVTSVSTGWSRNQGSIPSRGQMFFSNFGSVKTRYKAPTSPLSSWYHVLAMGVKQTTLLCLVTKLKMYRALYLLNTVHLYWDCDMRLLAIFCFGWFNNIFKAITFANVGE